MTTRVFTKSDAQHVFTFGPDQHPIPGAYVLIKGCDAEAARLIMFALYKADWCGQYEDWKAEEIQQDIARYSLVQVVEVGGAWTEN